LSGWKARPRSATENPQTRSSIAHFIGALTARVRDRRLFAATPFPM
jgi:hypothetical protein